jgi:hypothetical protein
VAISRLPECMCVRVGGGWGGVLLNVLSASMMQDE